jgi:hypothetical protein
MQSLFNLLKIIIILIIFTCIFSCTTNKDEKIIPRKEFVKVLSDLHLVDALISRHGLGLQTSKDSLPVYYHYILDKYDISVKSFENSLAYYSNDLKDFMEIYDEVIANIKIQIPKKLNDKSIYKFYQLALEDAKIKLDPDKWLGADGQTLLYEPNTKTFTCFDSLANAKYKEKLRFKCLLLLQSELFVNNVDSLKNIKMSLKINYQDSSYDLVEKPIKIAENTWTTSQLFIKTDSIKKTSSVECFIIKTDTFIGKKQIMLRNYFVRQYPYNKDTTLLIKKDPEIPPLNKKKNSFVNVPAFKQSMKKTNKHRPQD